MKKLIEIVNNDESQDLISAIIFSVVAIMSPIVTLSGGADLTVIALIATICSVFYTLSYIVDEKEKVKQKNN